MDYGLNTSYDPCTYPGVRCYFYYNEFIQMESNKVLMIKQYHL